MDSSSWITRRPGGPSGVEITAPEAVTLDRTNALLGKLGQLPLPEREFKPLTAA